MKSAKSFIYRHRHFILRFIDIVLIIVSYVVAKATIDGSGIYLTRKDLMSLKAVILVAVVVFEAVMEILHMYKNLVAYENGDDYIRYVLGSIIACIIVSTVHVFMTLDVEVIKVNALAFMFVAIGIVLYRIILRAIRKEQIKDIESLYKNIDFVRHNKMSDYRMLEDKVSKVNLEYNNKNKLMVVSPQRKYINIFKYKIINSLFGTYKRNWSSRKTIYSIFKRLIGFVMALVGIIILSPIMIIIAIAIKIDSKGPIIFKQKRTGKNGKVFNVWKFRTMYVSNDVHDFSKEDKHTRIGTILRKTSLDELPQFFNILFGQMAFIGPRPWIPEYYKFMNDEQRQRTHVLPGVTGLAQAKGRNNISIFQKINYDLEYIDNYSLREDIKVIFLTIKTVLSKEGADAGKTTIKNELKALKMQSANFIENNKAIIKKSKIVRQEKGI